MPNDGKQLENLVSFVEGRLLPQGFEVKTNVRVHENGVQIAEFDIEAKGRLGSTNITWLIECRDRPTEGPAPGSWIEQLVSRRSRFGFNKVTAVSTTGFSEGAIKYAEAQGIELREVKALTANQFDWLQMNAMQFCTRIHALKNAKLIVDESDAEKIANWLNASDNKKTDKPLLQPTDKEALVTVNDAFINAVSQIKDIYDDLEPGAKIGKPVNLKVQYTNDASHFAVLTNEGSVRIKEILFEGELFLKQEEIPISHVSEYARVGSGEVISQSAAFAFPAHNKNFLFEMHRIPDSGFTHVILRNLGDVTNSQKKNIPKKSKKKSKKLPKKRPEQKRPHKARKIKKGS